MKTRREFIKATSALAALALIPSIGYSKLNNKQYIGIQLYTIRKKLKEDFLGAMSKISEIGFNSIETAGYSNGTFYGYKPKDFKSYTSSLGLKAISSHTNVQLSDLDQIIDDTLEAGMEYLVKPSISSAVRKTTDDYKRLAEEFNRIGEKCNKAGLRFSYHNHAFEFEQIDNQLPYDILLNNTEKKLVAMQLDTYWMVYGGYSPIEYINKYPGRFELFHIKDMANTKKRETTEIGNGRIDFRKIFNASQTSGMKYFFLEQEGFKMNEFESLEISMSYIKSIIK